MTQSYLLLQSKGRRWKLVRRYNDLNAACSGKMAHELANPSRRFEVAIEDEANGHPASSGERCE